MSGVTRRLDARRQVALVALIAVTIAIALAGCGGDDRAAETVTVTDTGETTEALTSGTEFGDGTHVVGEDIEPGTYTSEGGPGCYWARLSSFSGDLDAIIANENASGQAVVAIAPSDAGFQSNGCGIWSTRSTNDASPEAGTLPEIAVTEFMRSCMAQRDPNTITRTQMRAGCTCMIRKFQKVFSLEEFLQQPAGALSESPRGKRIVSQCIAEVLSGG